MVLKLKISFNGDVRRLASIPRDYSSLQLEAFKTHEIAVYERTNLVLKYIDDEGDFVTLSSSRDFEEALAIALEELRKSLKLFIFDKNQVAAEHQLASRLNSAASYVSESVATASVAGGSISGLSSLVSPASVNSYPPPAPLASFEPAPVAPATPQPAETTATKEPQTPKETAKEETETEKEEAATPEEKEGEKPTRRGVRQQLLDFIRDVKVQSELPDAVLVWFATLREGLNSAAQEAASATNDAAKAAIVKAFDTVLETFEAIGSNELVKKARRLYVEHLANRAAPFVPLIVGLDENQVVIHVKKLLELLNNRGDGDFSCDAFKEMLSSSLPANIGAFLPMAGAFFGGAFPGAEGAPASGPFGSGVFDMFGTPNDDDDDDEDEEDEEDTPTAADGGEADPAPETDADGSVIHYGVECDGCKVAPIVGVRFKCYNCPDFDLCGKCEADMDPLKFFGTNHKLEHMMIKYRKARDGPGEQAARARARGCSRPRAGGAHRWGGRGRCNRNRFGGRRHHGRFGRRHGHGPGGWWRGGNQQQGAVPDFSQMGPFGAMLGNMMNTAGGQQGANPFASMMAGMNGANAGANPFASMMGGMNGANAGAGAMPFDPQMLEQMMGGMFGGGGGGMGRGRCGRGRRGGRPGKRGQRGPYNAEVVRPDATAERHNRCRRETKKVTLDNASYTFTIKNTGEAEWPAGARVVYIRHDRIGPMEIDLPIAKPGESVDITIPLSVDELEVGGRFHSVYRLKLPQNLRPPRKFGDPLHVRVEVVEKLDDEAEIDKAVATTEVVGDDAEKPKARKASALTPPEEDEETKDYTPPQAKPLAEQAKDVKPAAPAKPEEKPAREPAQVELPQGEHAEKLKLLAGMGFPQEDLNLWCLRENEGNVQKAALQLVQLYSVNT